MVRLEIIYSDNLITVNKCTTILAHVEEKHLTCCDVISRARGLHHVRTYSAATQKGVADLCLCQLATMYVQMHCIRFSLRIAVDM